MSYLLDTNTLIAALNGRAEVLDRLEELLPDEILLAAPVLAELDFGARCSRRSRENLERLERLVEEMHHVAFDQNAARRFGQIKSALRRQGISKSDFDLTIAAIALEQNVVLVSNDHAFHDQSIPDLLVEDWLLETAS